MREDTKPASMKSSPIPVPDSLREPHEAVEDLRDRHPELLDVGGSSRERALLILQGIAEACVARGYEFRLRDDEKPTFQIGVGDLGFHFSFYEEFTRVEAPEPEGLEAAKYDWQRVRSTVQKVRSGRLVIQLEAGYSKKSWADRKRWTLIDKLPDLFDHVQQRASEIAERRVREAREREERQRTWTAAVAQAKQDYIEHHNRQRLGAQLADVTRAQDLRRYADRIEYQTASMGESALRSAAQDWAAWVRGEADRVDPLMHPERLMYVEPENFSLSDINPFMAGGMNAHHPPR